MSQKMVRGRSVVTRSILVQLTSKLRGFKARDVHYKKLVGGEVQQSLAKKLEALATEGSKSGLETCNGSISIKNRPKEVNQKCFSTN